MKKRVILICLLLVISTIAIIIPATTTAMTVEVIITFDKEIFEHRFSLNESNHGLIYANITCNIDAEDYEYEYVKVRIQLVHSEWWDLTFDIEHIFTESGRQRISLGYTIPRDTPNGTINHLTLKGTWYVEKYGTNKREFEGEAVPDECGLLVHKIDYPRGMEIVSGDPGESQDVIGVLGIPCFIGIIAIPTFLVLLLIIIIVRFQKRKKKKVGEGQ